MQAQDQPKIERMFYQMQAGIAGVAEVRKALDQKIAFDFNPLNFFRPDENKTSELLAFFLDPLQNHGQGQALLRCLTDYLNSNR